MMPFSFSPEYYHPSSLLKHPRAKELSDGETEEVTEAGIKGLALASEGQREERVSIISTLLCELICYRSFLISIQPGLVYVFLFFFH